jgi:mRNA interferase HigB
VGTIFRLMRMKLVGRDKLEEFARRHGDAGGAIQAWVAEVEAASWKTPQDIRTRYPTASILRENVVVFNIKGNRYRLETVVTYKLQTVLVRRIGTHAEYDRWSR